MYVVSHHRDAAGEMMCCILRLHAREIGQFVRFHHNHMLPSLLQFFYPDRGTFPGVVGKVDGSREMKLCVFSLLTILALVPATFSLVNENKPNRCTKCTSIVANDGGVGPFQQFFDDVVQSSKFESRTLDVKSKSTMLLSFAVTVISLMMFQFLTQIITQVSLAGGFSGDVSKLLIFDLRNGYTPSEAKTLLEAWGSVGRNTYLAIEAVDVFAYHLGYRTFFVALLNHLTSAFASKFPQLSKIRWVAFFPIILAIVDRCEDVGQILATALYEITGGSIADTSLWTLLVKGASFINVEKWKMVRFGSACTLAIAVTLTLNWLSKSFLSSSKEQ